jgi:hypothetical protein
MPIQNKPLFSVGGHFNWSLLQELVLSMSVSADYSQACVYGSSVNIHLPADIFKNTNFHTRLFVSIFKNLIVLKIEDP